MADDTLPKNLSSAETVTPDTSLSDTFRVDVSNCDREPIHIPGFIQPHGTLFALDEPALTVLQASDNTTPYFGRSASELLGTPLSEVLNESSCQLLSQALRSEQVGSNPLHVFSTTLEGSEFHGLVHRYEGIVVLELERAITEGAVSYQNLYALVSGAVTRLESASDRDELCRLAAREMRQLAGLDKVMIYLFDETWNGLVVAEDKVSEMESYLDLRFPASDIPRQARDLYLRNKLRLISDVYAVPVPIIPTRNPLTERSLDLSYSALRSVSPIHIEYLKNMGVAASMSVAIVREGKLVGLFACHHQTPKYLSYEVRTACAFLGQVLALQLAAREQNAEREQQLQKANLGIDLLEAMTQHADYIGGLSSHEAELIALVGAQGVAVCAENGCTLLGKTPLESEVQHIVEWVAAQGQEVVATDVLPRELEGAESFQERACGVLAISVSEVHRNFIVWFRPEVVQTMKWAGNPDKPVEIGTGLLHPRESFKIWKEKVRSRSTPWQPVEIKAAEELRAAIIGIVLRQAEERAQLSTELQRSNQELEAFSYSVSHDLRAPFRHITGFAQMLERRAADSLDPTSRRYLDTITQSAHYAGTLVDNLLAFSRMGRSEMRLGAVDMAQLCAEISQGLQAEYEGRAVEWRIEPLPTVRGDLAMLRLVVQNLLSNALKYTRSREPAVIGVACHEEPHEWTFTVRDNGVGFDMRYAEKLFGVFQRLHRAEDFEGTGIGLANTRRIIARHGGRTWGEGRVDEGATFGFSLPKKPLQKQAGETA